MKKPICLFVTGTDTSVGKTFISSLLCLGLRAAYWKPIQAGLPRDLSWVQKHTKLPSSHFLKETYLFKNPVSPHLAARLEKKRISLENLSIPETKIPYLIIEGCGGLFVPLNEKEFLIDLLQKWNILTLLVCRSSLGTINHTLLSLFALRSRNIPVLGVVMNGEKNEENRKAIELYGKVPVLAEIFPQKNLDPDQLKELFVKNFSSLELT